MAQWWDRLHHWADLPARLRGNNCRRLSLGNAPTAEWETAIEPEAVRRRDAMPYPFTQWSAP
ncbi:MAG: hypothetical protein KatS3mg019_0264 [Fimbriimonadales bacterium]|nr:MAG: hypothetical protein KatS3mg019_0264 [Fimbriimonadales bacterium]